MQEEQTAPHRKMPLGSAAIFCMGFAYLFRASTAVVKKSA